MNDNRIDTAGFEILMKRVADAWAACDNGAAARCFTEYAVYMEPPDRQLFRGREQLAAYFSPLQRGTFLDFHGIWFDESSQTGAAEFTFGMEGAERADHGVVVVTVAGERIATWREYHRPGPASFERFISTDAKTWEWHIGNYP